MYDNKKQKLNQHHKFESLKLTKKKKSSENSGHRGSAQFCPVTQSDDKHQQLLFAGRETECVEATKHTHNRGPCVNMISTDTLKQKKQQHTDHLISATLFQDEIMDGAHFKLKKT